MMRCEMRHDETQAAVDNCEELGVSTERVVRLFLVVEEGRQRMELPRE